MAELVVVSVVAAVNLAAAGWLAWRLSIVSERAEKAQAVVARDYSMTLQRALDDHQKRSAAFSNALIANIELLIAAHAKEQAETAGAHRAMMREMAKQMFAAVGGSLASSYGRLDVTQRSDPNAGARLEEMRRADVARAADTLRTEDGEPIIPVGME